MGGLTDRNPLYARWRGDCRPLSPEELSQAISFARISLIVGLVFLHYHSFPNSRVSPFDGLDATQHQVATFINSFVLFFLFSVVPLLSMVSGWLFFSFPAESAIAALSRRIRRRFVSLYLPLVVWNALFLSILWLLFSRAPTHSLLQQLNIQFQTADLPDYINAVFAITKHPVGFQFWFVRDLFVTVLISPVLWVMLRRAPCLGAILLGLAWIMGMKLFIFFRTDVLFFFYLGGLLRLRKAPLQISRQTTLMLVAAYVLLVALRTLAPYVLDHEPSILTVATRAMRLVGVLAGWGLVLWVAPTSPGKVIARYGGLAFFLHAAHYPLLAEIKIILWPLVPSATDGWMLAHYAASVAVTVTLGISAGLVLARWVPPVFALMNGGRAFNGPEQDSAGSNGPTQVVSVRPERLP